METLYITNANEFYELANLLKFFKRILINLYNEFFLPTYLDCLSENMEVDDPLNTIFAELAITSNVLSLIIDRKKHKELFQILEDKNSSH